ncbi:MAG TPA: hypothetical protein VFV68_12960, partial [Agriterribacter sp.]|nr:hypothetical protein [Agriterribacter sp.]
MDSFYFIIALITAGIALAMGLVSIFIGLHRDGDKVDVIFGIMSLCVFAFFLSPPIGFILIDKAPYTTEILIKRVFNYSFTALFPWFIALYTGHKKRIIPWVLTALASICYLVMFYTSIDSPKPLWVTFALVALGSSIVYGFYAGYRQ